MSAIYRYEVPVDDLRHSFKLHGDIVHVDGRGSTTVEFWALHRDGGAYGAERTFLVVGTGHQLPHDYVRHIGTHVAGFLVWHLIEVES